MIKKKFNANQWIFDYRKDDKTRGNYSSDSLNTIVSVLHTRYPWINIPLFCRKKNFILFLFLFIMIQRSHLAILKEPPQDAKRKWSVYRMLHSDLFTWAFSVEKSKSYESMTRKDVDDDAGAGTVLTPGIRIQKREDLSRFTVKVCVLAHNTLERGGKKSRQTIEGVVFFPTIICYYHQSYI